LQGQQKGLLESLCDPAQEPRGVGAVDQPVIIGKRQRQQEPRLELPVIEYRLLARARNPENRHFRRMDDRGELGAADPPEVGDREDAPFQFLEGDLPAPRLLRQPGQFDGQLADVLFVGIAFL